MSDHEHRSRIARTPSPDPARTALREALIDARRPASDMRRRVDNAALVARLEALLGDVAGESIAVYWPIRGEPDLGALPMRWFEAGARLALPVVVAPRTALRFVEWTPGEAMVPGAWNIPRPVRDVVLRPTTVVVPCVGFTALGHRLGYGGGFYDRSFASLGADGGARPRAVGVGWDEARLETFEPLPTDRALDAVVTPSATYHAPHAPGRSR